MNYNIYLIGMPGCGKSSFGNDLSKKLGLSFIDTDNEIEINSSLSIPLIFEKYGESRFRDIEKNILKKISKLNGKIVSTGGGIIKNPENIKIMKSTGIIVFIDRPLKELINDIDTTDRPLLSDNLDKIKDLYTERYDIYKEACNIHVTNDTSFVETLDKLLLEIKKYI